MDAEVDVEVEGAEYVLDSEEKRGEDGRVEETRRTVGKSGPGKWAAAGVLSTMVFDFLSKGSLSGLSGFGFRFGFGAPSLSGICPSGRKNYTIMKKHGERGFWSEGKWVKRVKKEMEKPWD